MLGALTAIGEDLESSRKAFHWKGSSAARILETSIYFPSGLSRNQTSHQMISRVIEEG